MSKINLIEKKIPKIISRPGLYDPLQFSYKGAQQIWLNKLGIQLDGIIELKYKDKTTRFIAELKSATSPRVIQNALYQIERYRESIQANKAAKSKFKKLIGNDIKKINFILIIPYLTDTILELAKQFNVNVIDLCGNYNIETDNIVAIRRDQENQFKDSKPIKKIFSGNSSLVSRFLFKNKKVYTSVNEIYDGVLNLGGELALSTVSKVLQVLEDELMINKERNRIEVMQADKLLNALEQGYQKPLIDKEIKLKIEGGLAGITKYLNGNLKDSWVFSGDSSVNQYAVTTETTNFKVYTKNIEKLDSEIDDRFSNLILQETESPYVYFDVQKNSANWSSDLQCYLELMQGDKREKEIAESIKQNILRRFK